MKILIDADACPKPIKTILFRAAEKRQVECILVANQTLEHPRSQYIRSIRVSKGFDMADDRIVELVAQHDLIITADIPLAADAIKNGGVVITPHGKTYTPANISEALAMRDLLSEMRDLGTVETKTKPFSNQASQAFAAQLDQYLTKHIDI